MKPLKHSLLNPLLSFCAIVAAAVIFSSSAPAQLIAYDEADNYVVSANWTNGANQGFGFTPWAIETNGPNFEGSFLQSLNVPVFSIATATNVMGTNYEDIWGLYANGTNGVNEVTAYRGFNNSLGTNTFKLQWGSTGAGNQNVSGVGTVHGFIGFSLRTGNNTNGTYDLGSFPEGTMQFALYFVDGSAFNTLIYYDANGAQSVPKTSFSNLGRANITNAVEAEITPGADGATYHFVLKDCVLNQVLFVTNGTLISAGSTIDSAALFCYEATGDQIYNRMQIVNPTNIPPTIVNPQPGDGSLYVSPGATNLSYEVDSFNSTVAGGSVSVYLNGVLQSGSSFNTPGGTNQLLGTNAVTLASDTLYNYTIVAQDANGNVASNNYTFNTFLPTDLYIDAGDYNDGSGQFINSSTPSDAYANLLGTNLVDYNISDLTGANNTAGYRPGDLVQLLALATDATGDPVDHANLRLNGGTAYNIGFTVAGNWENYTRVIPGATNYSIYARAASGTGGQFEIERLTNATAVTSNLSVTALGRVNVPVTGGSLIYNGELTPLTDAYGNTVVLPLAGTNTLRETAISSQGYNLEYLLVVAVTNATSTLRPYLATATPAPNATGVGLLASDTFTIANRQTTLNLSNIKFYTNSVLVASGVSSNANSAGIALSFTPTANRAPNTTYTNTVIYMDSASVLTSNTWTFVTGTSGGFNANGVWTGLGGTNNMTWASATNWAGGTPGPGFFASFASGGATTTPVTNNIVAANVTIQGLFYATNNSGYHTTWIQDGVTLTVTNGTTGGATALIQVGGQPGNGGDNAFNQKVTNTITGTGGTLLALGNPLSSGLANNLNFQIRQDAANASIPNLVTFDMSGLGTMVATVGKFFVAQGGSGGNQTNVSACVYLARTNIISCLRPNAGQFEVGDSSGGLIECPGSTLYLGITNALYADTVRFGKQKATNNLICFNPAFTNSFTPAVVWRGGTNGPASRVYTMTIGDADTETTVPNYVQANVDYSGGKVDAMVSTLIIGRGETAAGDTGYAQGTLSLTAGTLDVNNVTNGVQRANNTATETGVVNLNGTATLVSSNITLALAASGANASLVSGTLNVTNATVRGNIYSGGGVSTVNLKSGTLIVSNSAGTATLPLTALNLSTASLHFRADGNATGTFIYASSVGVSGTSTITIDSVANVTSTRTNHLINYAGPTPRAGLTLAPMPSGYTGSLVDSGTSIDLLMGVAVSKPPTIRNFTISSSGLVIISGTNNVGAGGSTYSVLTTNNLLAPLTNWTVLTNGAGFDAFGNFSYTNSAGTNALQFYILRVP